MALTTSRSFGRVCPPSLETALLNTLLCLALGLYFSFYGLRFITLWPLTFESIWQCGLAELNRRKGLRRIRQLEDVSENADLEKANKSNGFGVTFMASVVGYREELSIFRKCLESYRPSAGLKFLLVGIDGNEHEDLEMANIVESVYPENTKLIAIDEPFGFLALRLAEAHAFGSSYKPSESLDERLDDFQQLPAEVQKESQAFAMSKVFEKGYEILQKHRLLERSETTGTQAICFHQPHVCKKDIMFTNLIFSIILGKLHDLEHLWSSDSDTFVMPDTVQKCVAAMCLDPRIGGSCVTLGVHNAQENWISAMGAAAYWCEMAITRSQNGIVDAVDCQPGPCAAFKLEALEPIMFDWYTQTCLGVRTVVNEDRHLTTKILLSNYKVTFLSSALVMTDTPTTLIGWLLQQLRWSRAANIERFQYPMAYAIHGPVLFINAMGRYYGPLSIGIFALRYVLGSDGSCAYSVSDFFGRIFLYTAYNYVVNPTHISAIKWWYLPLSTLFYQLPLPGIIFWSSITALQGSWGNKPSGGQGGEAKKRNDGWDNLGAVLAVTAWMGIVAAAVTKAVISKLVPELAGFLPKMAAVSMMFILGWGLLRTPKPKTLSRLHSGDHAR